MLYSIYENLNKILSKDRCFNTYKILVDEFADYDKVSRKKMVQKCIEAYKNNPGMINYIFNEEELKILYSLPERISDKEIEKVLKFSNFFLYCTNDYFSDYTITLELKDVLDEAKKIYYNSKEIIEKEKESQYLVVGLFRVFGALTPNEFSNILDSLKCDNIVIQNYYFNRFVCFDDCNGIRCAMVLKELVGYSEEIIETHPKKIHLKFDVEQLKDIGCHYFDRKSPHYINAMRHQKIKDFLNEPNSNNFIIFSGSSLSTNYFYNNLDNFISKLNTEENNDLFNLLNCLPKYYLSKNQDNILSLDDGDLFYRIMLPFLEFVGNKFGIKFDYNKTDYNGEQANEIFKKCTENDFKFVDEYIKKEQLDEEAISILNSLKKRIKGPFVVLKHLKNGSVFMDLEENLYLVKGIKTPIEMMSGLDETPTLCDTFIFQFKDSIIYSSIIIPYRVKMVGNMKKSQMRIYNEKKNQIIKKLF